MTKQIVTLTFLTSRPSFTSSGGFICKPLIALACVAWRALCWVTSCIFAAMGQIRANSTQFDAFGAWLRRIFVTKSGRAVAPERRPGLFTTAIVGARIVFAGIILKIFSDHFEFNRGKNISKIIMFL
jgi:hypothetical protein